MFDSPVGLQDIIMNILQKLIKHFTKSAPVGLEISEFKNPKQIATGENITDNPSMTEGPHDPIGGVGIEVTLKF